MNHAHEMGFKEFMGRIMADLESKIGITDKKGKIMNNINEVLAALNSLDRSIEELRDLAKRQGRGAGLAPYETDTRVDGICLNTRGMINQLKTSMCLAAQDLEGMKVLYDCHEAKIRHLDRDIDTNRKRLNELDEFKAPRTSQGDRNDISHDGISHDLGMLFDSIGKAQMDILELQKRL